MPGTGISLISVNNKKEQIAAQSVVYARRTDLPVSLFCKPSISYARAPERIRIATASPYGQG